MLDIANTDHSDLRGGIAPWQSVRRVPMAPLAGSTRCDVAIIGAGITGALAAEHLSAQGLDVCIVDREKPALGSTAASTAMILWEIDQPLRALSRSIGFDRAAYVYQQSAAAVSGLCALIASLQIDCHLRLDPSLYLAAGDVDANELRDEHELRMRAGLPGDYLEHRALLSRYAISREAALLSPGSADVDPVCLSQGLLAIAAQRGVRLIKGCAEDFDSTAKGASVMLDCGKTIDAKWVVLATGYALPDFIKSDMHTLASTWAIATPPQPRASLWPDNALIWEASDDYHYVRTTADNRIIMGGEDDDAIIEPDARDALIGDKARTLLEQLRRLFPNVAPVADFAWAGAFGKTRDGLPMIGVIPGRSRMLGAYGYGGNGITFSFLASRIVADVMRGDARPWFESFAFDRDVPSPD